MKRIVMVMLAAGVLALTVGCRHTAHGAGEDIERVGEKIQEKTR